MAKAVFSASIVIDVPFFDVDAMRVVWHGHYVKYFELARCELLGKMNYDYNQMEATGYMWPITDIRLRYIKPAKFGSKIKVTASLIEYDMHVKINYEIRDAETNEKLCKGYTVQVAVLAENFEMQYETPTEFVERLEAYLAKAD